MLYYYSNDGTNQQGPVDLSGLRAAGITRQTLVWHEGMPAWTPAGEVAELSAIFDVAQPIYPPVEQPVAPSVQSPVQQSQGPQSPSLSYQGPSSQYQYPYQQQSPNGMAIASMIMGILGILTFCFYCFGLIPSILAVVFGHISRGQIKRGQGSGEGMALAGLILGYISVGLVVLLLVIGVGASFLGSTASRTFTPSPTVVPAPQKIPVPPTNFPKQPTFPTK